MRVVLICIIGLSVLFVGATATDGKPVPFTKKKATTAKKALKSFVWHDGARKRTVWLSPDQVADFTPTEAEKEEFRAKHPDPEKSLERTAKPRLKKLRTNQEPLDWSDRENRQAGAKVSPLFHESPNGGRTKRALPGNIIVSFKADWDEAKIRDWAEIQGLTVLNKLNLPGNHYVLKTEPGIVALETANRIHDSGEVLSASPDWWTEVSTR